jgi:glycosyltransferase involved in cell wall biosynthesis
MKKYEFNSILFVGPDFRNHRGGIGATLFIYNSNISKFQQSVSFRPLNNFFKVFVFILGLINFLKYLLLNLSIKIIHIHGSHGASVYRKYIYFFIGKYIFKKKIIYHIHSGTFDFHYVNGSYFYRKMCESLIRKSDSVFVLSQVWKKIIISLFSPQNIAIINNVIENNNYLKDYSKRKEKIHILFLGRIGPNKGIYDLLQTIYLNKSKFKEYIQLYVGGDGEIEYLKNQINLLELSGCVEYIGWVADSKKNHFLEISDILILPSYNEGLPISILEAMSYGMPIIASNVGGIPEVVTNMWNGRIVTPGNIDQIYDAIEFYIKNPDKIANHGKNSLSKIQEFYPESVFPKLENIYKSILDPQSNDKH